MAEVMNYADFKEFGSEAECKVAFGFYYNHSLYFNMLDCFSLDKSVCVVYVRTMFSHSNNIVLKY